MSKNIFDAIVIGAGAMGSSATYHLARAGKRVLALEQFELAHNRGSSHGESRIFRYSYPDINYVKLAIQTIKLWHELEQEADEKLLRTVGGIDIGEGEFGHTAVREVANALKASGSQWEEYNLNQLIKRYPQFHFENELLAVYSPDTGVLPPTRAIQVITEQAIKYHAEIHDCEPVLDIELDKDSSDVKVITTKDNYRAKSLIITAGAWAGEFLNRLNCHQPMQISQEQTVYFRPIANGHLFNAEKLPVWIHYRDEIVYGIPSFHATPAMKVSFHHSGKYIDIKDYRQEIDENGIERLRAYLREYIPDLAGEAFDATTCLYTNTPDQNFIVDLLPGYHNVAIGAGFSGHGFKFALGIGRALTDLITKGRTEMHIDHFKIDRF